MADLVDDTDDDRIRPNSGRDVVPAAGSDDSLATDRSDCVERDLRNRPKIPVPVPDDTVSGSTTVSAARCSAADLSMASLTVSSVARILVRNAASTCIRSSSAANSRSTRWTRVSTAGAGAGFGASDGPPIRPLPGPTDLARGRAWYDDDGWSGSGVTGGRMGAGIAGRVDDEGTVGAATVAGRVVMGGVSGCEAIR